MAATASVKRAAAGNRRHVKWLSRAIANLEAHTEHIAQDNPRTAYELADLAYAATEMLSRFPLLGRIGRVQGTRELVIPDTPFIIVYVVKPKSIQIIRMLHGKQLWPRRN